MEEVEHTGTLKQKLAKLFEASLNLTFPDEHPVEPLVVACSPKIAGHYQCNNAMDLWSQIREQNPPFTNPQEVGQALIQNLPNSEMVESCSVAGPGFINVVLSPNWMAKRIGNMLVHGIDTWAPTLPVKTALVDFSSPNIAKKMHVGHLRSTIIGDTIARMLEFSKVEVLRRNHVGDWGTQFGMLIEYLFEIYADPALEAELSIEDLHELYREANARFKSDSEFKERAQQGVVRLQSGDPEYHNVWEMTCEITRTECSKIYQRLGVELEEKGESFYNPYIPQVIEELKSKNLVKEDDGAQVIYIEELDKSLLVVKSDGGYNYATTDITALWYRLNVEKAEWIIYVAGSSQAEHFDMFFKVARKAGWIQDNDKSYPRTSHVGFGNINGKDGKAFRTRNSEVYPLVDLLDKAKTRCKSVLIERGKGKDKEWSAEELDQTAEAVGYSAVKYADLKDNRLTGYKFNEDKMLNDKGNTAVYLLYAHARICKIIEKSGKDIEELKKTENLVLDLAEERALGLHLLRFSETVEEACTSLLPNLLCEYLYNLSEYYNKFYSNCRVIGSEQETSRLLLCEATAIVMRKCFYLLGITPVYEL